MQKSHYEILLDYCLGLNSPADNTENLQKAQPLFDEVNAQLVFELVDEVVGRTAEIGEAKRIVTRMLHSFTKPLNAVKRPFERGFSYIEHILEQNDKIVGVLDALKADVSRMNEPKFFESSKEKIAQEVQEVSTYVEHYEDKENVLFPVIEKHLPNSRCLQVMWSIHDDVRLTLKELNKVLLDPHVALGYVNTLLGRLFFDMYSMVFREEQILFPVIIKNLPREELLTLGIDQFSDGQASPYHDTATSKGKIDLITGNPTVTQLLHIFNTIPVDITLVDASDRVVYFNTPQHRIFARSKAVVGRMVQNCHPPESFAIVQNIIDSFRSKKRREADFRITLKGRYILIRYVALYDEDDTYAGTIEISQDITDIKNLKGEKRLLDWEA